VVNRERRIVSSESWGVPELLESSYWFGTYSRFTIHVSRKKQCKPFSRRWLALL